MNKFNLEITYKDICSVTLNNTPFETELIVELIDGSTIKACQCTDPSDIRSSIPTYSSEKYDALNKVVNDYLRFARALKAGTDSFGKTLGEVEKELIGE